MNLIKCLQTDGVTILKERQKEEKNLEKIYENELPLLLDNEHEKIYFVKFADEMPEIRIPFGDFLCFGKIGFEKQYFVIDKEGKIFKYDFYYENESNLVFVNSSLTAFYRSYCRYMAGIFMYKAHQKEEDFPMEAEVERITEFIKSFDPAAVENEQTYWSDQLCILEDGFAHLIHNAVDRMLGMPKHNYQQKKKNK